jgi:hypothetical protein
MLMVVRNISTNAPNEPLMIPVVVAYLAIPSYFLSLLSLQPNLRTLISSALLITTLYHTTGALVPLLETMALQHQSSALDLNHDMASKEGWSSTQV